MITPGVGRTTTGVSNAMAEGYWKGYQEKLHADAADRKPIEADTTFKVSHEEALKALSRTLMLIRHEASKLTAGLPCIVVSLIADGFWRLHAALKLLNSHPVASEAHGGILQVQHWRHCQCYLHVARAQMLEQLTCVRLSVRERHKGPLVVVLECPGGATWLSKEVPMLRDVPVIESSLHSMDSQYASIAWQPRAVEVAMLRTAQMPSMMKVQGCCSCTNHFQGDP